MSALNRPLQLGIGGRAIPLPAFFPSVSSVKTNFLPVDYARFLAATSVPNFLISAYDIFHASWEDKDQLYGLLNRAYEGDGIVLLDSGGYESYWLRDATWTHQRFEDMLQASKAHLAFSYDNQDVSLDPSVIAEGIEVSVLRDQEAFHSGTIVPIVHASMDLMPETVLQVASRLKPLMIAVPERELGDGILARAATLSRIREVLDEGDYYCPLHLLGTGNPLSILLYTACGADSFDGLEWCQTVTVPGTVKLLHFHQYDLLTDSDQMALPYTERVLLSNLLYYSKLIGEIRHALETGEMGKLISRYLSDQEISRLRGKVPGIE